MSDLSMKRDYCHLRTQYWEEELAGSVDRRQSMCQVKWKSTELGSLEDLFYLRIAWLQGFRCSLCGSASLRPQAMSGCPVQVHRY